MNTTVKVLQVLGTLNIGGAESRMMDVFREIDRDCYTFDFLVLNNLPDYFFENEINTLSGTIHKVSKPKLRNAVGHLREVAKVMRSGNYDVIHAHVSFYNGLILLLAKMMGIEIRISHARNSNIQNKTLGKRMLLLVSKMLIKHTATSLLSVSDKASEFLYAAGDRDKILCIKNGIDVGKYQGAPDPDKVRELGLQSNTLNIVQIGRMEPVKNHLFSLALMKELQTGGVSSHLYLIGDGKKRSSIVSTIKKLGLEEHVTLLGLRGDVHDILRLFDVLLLPSFYEGLPGVVLEAQASGIRSMISATITPECDFGLGLVDFIPIDAAEAWVDAIAGYSRNPVSLEEIHEVFCEKGYEISQVVERIGSVYRGETAVQLPEACRA